MRTKKLLCAHDPKCDSYKEVICFKLIRLVLFRNLIHSGSPPNTIAEDLHIFSLVREQIKIAVATLTAVSSHAEV